MDTSETVGEIAAALAIAQGEISHALTERMNPAFKSRYADLSAVLDACRGPLSAAGIAVVQAPSVDLVEGGVRVSVETRLIHKSGQWMATVVSSYADNGKAQTIGSAITYLRRYGLSAMAGVAPDDDDDGNAAQQPQQRQPSPRAQAFTQASPTAPLRPAPSSLDPSLETAFEQLGRAVQDANFADLEKVAQRILAAKTANALSAQELGALKAAYKARKDAAVADVREGFE